MVRGRRIREVRSRGACPLRRTNHRAHRTHRPDDGRTTPSTIRAKPGRTTQIAEATETARSAERAETAKPASDRTAKGTSTAKPCRYNDQPQGPPNRRRRITRLGPQHEAGPRGSAPANGVSRPAAPTKPPDPTGPTDPRFCVLGRLAGRAGWRPRRPSPWPFCAPWPLRRASLPARRASACESS